MIVGPVFTREAVTAPRRARFYVQRTVYALSLLLLMCTAWMVVSGTQFIRNVGDLAAFEREHRGSFLGLRVRTEVSPGPRPPPA